MNYPTLAAPIIEPPKINLTDLACLNQKLFKGKFEPVEWQVKPLANKLVSPVSGGVFRVSGSGFAAGSGVNWSVILKILHARGEGDNPQDWNYWQREALAYRSGLLENLPGGLRAPRLFGIVEKPVQKETWLWLEEVENPEGPDWTMERYGRVARHLGLFNGAYLAGQELPAFDWLSKRHSLTWVQAPFPGQSQNQARLVSKLANTRLRAGLTRLFPGIMNFGSDLLFQYDFRLIRQPQTWSNPSVLRAFPRPVNDRLLRIWKNRRALLKILEGLPRTLCHLDAWNPNLFTHQEMTGTDTTTAIDWEFVGPGAVGEELVQLVWCNLYYFNVSPDEVDRLESFVFEKYLEGLNEAGWKGDARLVRLGYVVSAALRWALAVPGLGLALDESGRSEEERRWGRPVDQIIAHRTAMTYSLLDRVDQINQLIDEIQMGNLTGG